MDTGAATESEFCRELHPKKIILSVFKRDCFFNCYCETQPSLLPATADNSIACRRNWPKDIQNDRRPSCSSTTQGVTLPGWRAKSCWSWEVLPHPPYSPDLAPSDYHFCCPGLSHEWETIPRWGRPEWPRNDLQNFFDTQDAWFFFRKGTLSLHKCWRQMVETDGDYICDWNAVSDKNINDVLYFNNVKILKTFVPIR